MTDLKPCPFCGGEAYTDGPGAVVCCGCGAETSTHEEWNRRVGPLNPVVDYAEYARVVGNGTMWRLRLEATIEWGAALLQHQAEENITHLQLVIARFALMASGYDVAIGAGPDEDPHEAARRVVRERDEARALVRDLADAMTQKLQDEVFGAALEAVKRWGPP